MRKTVLALATVMALTASTGAEARQNEFFGTGIGAALGGLLGSQITRGEARIPATAAGVFFGGLIGNSVGVSMDRADSLYTQRQSNYYAPQPVYYETTRTAYVPNYVAPPAPQPVTYVSDSYGGYCREFSQQVRVGGRIQESYGTACFQPDGSWKIMQ